MFTSEVLHAWVPHCLVLLYKLGKQPRSAEKYLLSVAFEELKTKALKTEPSLYMFRNYGTPSFLNAQTYKFSIFFWSQIILDFFVFSFLHMFAHRFIFPYISISYTV